MAHIITVTGNRGGVGKSTFAANLAVSFALENKSRVLLVDLDLDHCGDLATILGLRVSHSLIDLFRLSDLELSTLERYLTSHPSGIKLINAYLNYIQVNQLTPQAFEKLLLIFKKNFDFIIIDCGSTVEELTVKAFDQSTAIMLMSEAEILTLNQTKRSIEKLQSLLFPKEIVKIILNKYEPEGAITPRMIQANLGRTIFAAIARDSQVCESALTKGEAVVSFAPRSLVAQSYFQLVRSIKERNILENLSQLKRPSRETLVQREGEFLKATGTVDIQPVKRFSRGKIVVEEKYDPRIELKKRIHKKLTEVMDLKKIDTETGYDPQKREVLRERTKKAVLGLLENEELAPTNRQEKMQLVKEILDEALGLGPLEALLADPSITEIMVNRRDQIYIEREGKIELTPCAFTSDTQLLGTIERIIAPIGRRIDEKTPFCDARLPDGSRVHAIIPPLSLQGPMITIRKFSETPFTSEDLIRFGSLSEEVADFFRACVEARLNIIVSGGTGTGKTTLLNVLSSFIPGEERIITVEDSAELQLNQPHIVRLESRPPSIEGTGAITIRDLVKNSLRMRPDRIIVGECRGGEALDMLQAMNTGHDGSLTTIHANSPRDCISRLETLVLMAGIELPVKAIREQITSAINIIVQLSRFPDGTRKIIKVTEVTGMQGDVISLQDIFDFKQTGVDENKRVKGEYVKTGFIPKFIESLTRRGIKIPKGLLFNKG